MLVLSLTLSIILNENTSQVCVIDKEDVDGFKCPCIQIDSKINRVGDGRLSGTGCICPAGYEPDEFGKCVDTDECIAGHDCDWKSECFNVDGSYGCSCREGYEDNGYDCDDIDECLGMDLHQTHSSVALLRSAESINTYAPF